MLPADGPQTCFISRHTINGVLSVRKELPLFQNWYHAIHQAPSDSLRKSYFQPMAKVFAWKRIWQAQWSFDYIPVTQRSYLSKRPQPLHRRIAHMSRDVVSMKHVLSVPRIHKLLRKLHNLLPTEQTSIKFLFFNQHRLQWLRALPILWCGMKLLKYFWTRKSTRTLGRKIKMWLPFRQIPLRRSTPISYNLPIRIASFTAEHGGFERLHRSHTQPSSSNLSKLLCGRQVITLARPFILLATELVVLALSLYMGLINAISFVQACSLVFEDIYGSTIREESTAFIGILI